MSSGDRPDPREAVDPIEFMELLQQLRVWAGKPSLAELRRRTGLPRTTLHDALSSNRRHLPSLDLVRRLVEACGCGPDEVRWWANSWRRLQAPVRQAAAGPSAGHRSTTVDQVDPALVPAGRDRIASVVPRQLPATVSGFAGRTEEIKWLTGVFDGWVQGDCMSPAIALICGAPGVGKTALAVRWAQRTAEHFPDGQLYLDLRGFAVEAPMAPKHALVSMLSSLGVPSQRIPIEEEAQAALYRSLLADRRVMVVLDNAATVRQVRPLLPGSPTCLVLVTSRHGLPGLVARDGAARLVVPRLNGVEAREVLAGVIGADRVGREEPAAARLAEVCAHLPLALRIAGAQLVDSPHATLADYTAALAANDPVTQLAVAGDDDAGVAAAFDRSYKALPPEAQRLLCLLSVVPGPNYPPPAAAAMLVSTTAQAAELLQVLANLHLVEPVGPNRFGLHDLLRAYAARRAADGDRDAAPRRLLEWYLYTAHEARKLVHRDSDRIVPPLPEPDAPATAFERPEDALTWFDEEEPSALAAIGYAYERGWHDLALWLPQVLWRFFLLRGHVNEWIRTHVLALSAAGALGNRRAEAAILVILGNAYSVGGRYGEAYDCYRRSLDLARSLPGREGEAYALASLGVNRLSVGDYEAAREHLRLARPLFESAGDRVSQAGVLEDLGRVAIAQRRYSEALPHLLASLALFEEVGLRSAQALALSDLGVVHMRLRDLEPAIDHLERALAAFRESGDRRGEAVALSRLALVRAELGQAACAIELWREAVSLGGHIAAPGVLPEILGNVGEVCRLGGEYRLAATYHEKALAVATDLGDRAQQARAHDGLTQVLTAAGKTGLAATHRAAADGLFEQLGVRR